MTPRERRSLLVAAAVLLAASLIRYVHERSRGAPLLPPDSLGVVPELLEATRRARAEEERRRRPLDDGETIDPNRAPAVELDRLPGVGPAVAGRIVEERERAGGFRTAADLERVRGIGPATLQRMRPHLDLGRPPPLTARSRRAASVTDGAAGGGPAAGERITARSLPAADEPEAVDLNRATATELERLHGIGPALAARIVELRAERGGFGSVEELLEVRGIGPKTLERFRARVTLVP